MNNPLAELKDIHIPQDVSSWPLAYGWWLLITLCIGLIVFVCWYGVRRWRLHRIKRLAVAELAAITADQDNWPSAMNTLLKRAVRAYFSDLPIQQLHGQTWSHCLAEALPTTTRSAFLEAMQGLQQQLYQPKSAQDLVFEDCQRAVNTWLKQSLPPSRATQQRLHMWWQTQQEGKTYV
jgi:hypothetical protein